MRLDVIIEIIECLTLNQAHTVDNLHKGDEEA